MWRDEKNDEQTDFLQAIKDLIEAKFIIKVKSGGLYRIKSKYKFIGKYRYFYFNGGAIK